jgi:hypothetical protein
MSDVWVCANCRSINKQRAKQCYQCRTPKDLAAVDPMAISSTTHGQVRHVQLPAFHPSAAFALLASILILAFVGLEVVRTLVASAAVTQIVVPSQPAPLDEAGVRDLGIAVLGVGLLALVSWSLWLSRVVVAMPALGLGYPAATGLTAFVENFIPGLNLLRVPAILRDVVHRLEPRQGRVDALMFAAWIGLIGGLVIPRLGAILLIGAETREQLVRNMIVIASVSVGIVVAGALFLVALIWWIEMRISRRRRTQLAEWASQPVATPPIPEVPPGPPAGPAEPPPWFAPPPRQPLEPARLVTETAALAPVAHDGPRLTVTVEADGTITAELDGSAEAITMDDLRAAAGALARAGGSAVVRTSGTGAGVHSAAAVVADTVRAAGVPTDFEG